MPFYCYFGPDYLGILGSLVWYTLLGIGPGSEGIGLVVEAGWQGGFV